ncbi:MAG: type 4a pilus biogenesis protein PilO [Deltaproteobacteria bacterium]|nr:type 4a pilus biogenesis protein PilO [Deltaproteobacteria bacterium]
MNQSLKQKLIVVLCICFLALIYFSLIYSPTQDVQLTLESNIKKLDGLTTQHKKELEELEKRVSLPSDKKDMDSTISHALPNKVEVASFLKDISKIGQSLKIQFLEFRPQEKVQKTNYILIPFHVKIQGKFPQVLGFFDKITDTDKLITVSGLKLTLAEKDASLVKADAVITTFQRF